jgi:hypothetical protein
VQRSRLELIPRVAGRRSNARALRSFGRIPWIAFGASGAETRFRPTSLGSRAVLQSTLRTSSGAASSCGSASSRTSVQCHLHLGRGRSRRPFPAQQAVGQRRLDQNAGSFARFGPEPPPTGAPQSGRVLSEAATTSHLGSDVLHAEVAPKHAPMLPVQRQTRASHRIDSMLLEQLQSRRIGFAPA